MNKSLDRRSQFQSALRACSLVLLGLLAAASHHATASPLRIELTTAYNFIVDSNVETPSTYAPRAALISARIWNDGPTTITDVRAFVGDKTEDTPGIYPSRVHTENPDITGPLPGGAFALTHEGGGLGTSDASRVLADIPPGGYVPVYWLISYPNLDINAESVTGDIKPEDDLYLYYDVWVRGEDGTQTQEADVRRRVTMRNCISAMANKIFPHTANKVPQAYQDLLEKYEPEWNNIKDDGTPGTRVITEGIWYDLGNVSKGFDNDGNLVPDQNAWLQPIGDPSIFDAAAFRLVRTYALVIVKLKSGGEVVYDVSDQLYFTNIPDNNGVIGLVRYDFMPLKPNVTIATTPYQMAASGFDNEKFNGDYGTTFTLTSPASELDLVKSVDLDSADPGNKLDYTIVFSNDGDQSVGNPDDGVPLVVQDAIPAGTTYVEGSADAANILPAGVDSYQIFYSTDNGGTWTNDEPVPASSVTDIQWWLSNPLAASESGTVTFSVQISNPYTQGGAPVLNIAGLSFGNTLPFLEDDAITLLNGTLNISGTVFEDIGTGGGIFGDGELNGAEPGIPSVKVSLYYDANGNGIVDAGDILVKTVDSSPSSPSGSYLFENLLAGDYIVQVDRQDSDIPPGYTITSDDEIAVVLLNSDSTGNDFGFAPTLLVTKTGTVSAYPGQPVEYEITVENHYPNISQFATYTGYPTTTDPNHTPTQNNKAWTNPTNILGDPTGTYASAAYSNATKEIGPTNFNIAPQASSITAVNLDLMGMYRTGTFATAETLTIEVIQKPSTVLATYTITSAQLNALATAPNTTDFPINITGAKGSWAWADFGPTSNITIKLSTFDRTGPATGTIFVAGTRITLTTDQTISPNTLSVVPLTDTYNADELEFDDATDPPSYTHVVSGSVGTITWANIGPIAPGDSFSVTVNFIAKPLPGVNPIITTDVATVTGAEFENGDPANDGEDSADTLILPVASIGDTIFLDANRSGTQDLGEPGIAGVTVELLDQNDNVIATRVTDSNGNYLFTNLIPDTYTVRVVTATGPLFGWDLSADPDLDGVPFDPLNPDPLGDSEFTYTLTGGEWFTGADFGYVPPGYTLSGVVWIDFNGDGVVDENEIGLQFVTVKLYDSSDPNGAYLSHTAFCSLVGIFAENTPRGC
jgi:uncharacterized repeat protein (TIGR01451 family)